jgi:hypothetical protein
VQPTYLSWSRRIRGTIPTRYRYPTLSLTERWESDGDEYDEVVYFQGQMNEWGDRIDMDVELESGALLSFRLKRTFDYQCVL